MPPLVYLDTCCLNRLFDDQRQLRVRLETEAVRAVLQAVVAGDVRWLGSTAVDLEVGANPNAERRQRVGALAALATERVDLGEADRGRARAFEAAGLGAFDALHLTAAERGGADALLTTDDRFARRAARLAGTLPGTLRVLNPTAWAAQELNRS